jgi:hypothetical protein
MGVVAWLVSDAMVMEDVIGVVIALLFAPALWFFRWT